MPFNSLPPKRVLQAAIRGNTAAANRVAEWGLPQLRGKVEGIRSEIDRFKAEEWDEESARREAMNGNVPPGQTIGAFRDVHLALLRFLAYTPAAIVADPDEVEELNDLWLESVYRLMLTVHNPTVKYGIVGGFRPEVREEVADYFDRFGRELWGTMFALTSEDAVDAESFPPETADVIRSVGVAQQRLADQEEG